MTGSTGNSEFCFPSTSMYPSASPRETLRVYLKQNSPFPLGPVIKCLLFTRLACSAGVFLKARDRKFAAILEFATILTWEKWVGRGWRKMDENAYFSFSSPSPVASPFNLIPNP